MIDIRKGIGPKTCLKYSKLFMILCGVWPYQLEKHKRFFSYGWIFQQFIITASELIKLFEVRQDKDLLIQTLPDILYQRVNDVKLINAIVNQYKVKNLLQKMEDDWKSLSDEADIQILFKYTNRGKIITLLYIITIYSVVCACMFLPLTPKFLDIIDPLNESRPLRPLFNVEFFVDEKKYFYTILIHAYITVLLSPIPMIAVDTLYMNCIHHVCGMIKIFGIQLDNILRSQASENSSDKEKQLHRCINIHQRIFEFCNDVNSTFSTSFLIVLFLNMTLMSLTGVTAVIQLDDVNQLNDTIRYAVFTTAQAYHLFCLNYMGQLVLNAMNWLSNKVYDTDWYETSSKVQKLIKFIILRNLRPTMMKAMLFPLCLPTFTSVMKTAASYFTVIKSTR